MISLERKDSDNKQVEVILEEGIWMTYFPNSLEVVVDYQVEDSNSSISISEDLEAIREGLVSNNSNNNMKTYLKIQMLLKLIWLLLESFIGVRRFGFYYFIIQANKRARI